MNGLLNQIRYAARALGRTPAFTLTAILTIALGIGASTAIFSVVNAVLLRPLPYRDADRLVTIWSDLTAPGVMHRARPTAPPASPHPRAHGSGQRSATGT